MDARWPAALIEAVSPGVECEFDFGEIDVQPSPHGGCDCQRATLIRVPQVVLMTNLHPRMRFSEGASSGCHQLILGFGKMWHRQLPGGFCHARHQAKRRAVAPVTRTDGPTSRPTRTVVAAAA